MKRIKLLVLILFSLFASTIYFVQSPKVSGQSTTLTSPTGVSASNGSYTTKIGINWDTVRNATSYRIFRSTTNNSAAATEIGTTAAPYFFDASAPQNQTRFYWVRAENSANVSSLSSVAQGLRATGNPNLPVPPLDPPPAPAGNPVTATKVSLGKVLFWDEQLSATRTVSCGTCHINGASGSDPRSILGSPSSTSPGTDGIFGNGDDVTGSPGVPSTDSTGKYLWSTSYGINIQVTGRKANSSINAGYPDDLFWDGRATSEFRDPVTNQVIIPSGGALESQAAGPPVSDVEMAHTNRDWTATALQIETSTPLALSPNKTSALETWIGGRSYPELFLEAFGTQEVTPSRIAMAIATYERVLFSDRSPFDLLAGGSNTLTQQEQRGRQVFNGSNCNACHGGPRQTNDLFLYIGVRPQADDLGRFTVTGQNQNRGSMRVPSLRNVELRAPYMHNGRFATLEAVIAFYSRGGDFNAPNKAPQIVPQNFNPQETADLAAYLRRPLTDQRVVNETGPFERPTLYTESNRVPTLSGAGRAGTNGNVPAVMAVEPPIAGNPDFTVAVSNARSNAEAVLVINASDPGLGTSIPATGSFTRQTVQLADNGSGTGYGSVGLAIPTTADVVGKTFFGRWYINDPAAANGFSVSRLFQFTVFGEATAVTGSTRFDFDGDSKTDIGIFRPSVGEWWYLRSGDGGNRAFQFGQSTDAIVPADFTGDGKTDVAFFRPESGEWFVLRSEDSSFYSFPFGTAGDIPAPGDFDGDGVDDPAVFRPSTATWFILNSGGGTTITSFGASGDKPLIGDYDNDGKDDIAIYRSSVQEYWISKSTGSVQAFQFGQSGDMPLVADFTGDGSDDAGFFRPSSGEWFVLRSEDGSFFSFPFGTNGDIPVAGDYDGDGTADPAVFRPSVNTWFKQQSANGFEAVTFGASGDIPVPSAFIQ